MAEPAEVFIGWTGLGMGIILIYAAVKNKRPFTDIIKPAISGVKPLANPPLPSVAGGQVAAGPTGGVPNTTPFGGAQAAQSQAMYAAPLPPFGGATATGSQALTAGNPYAG